MRHISGELLADGTSRPYGLHHELKNGNEFELSMDVDEEGAPATIWYHTKAIMAKLAWHAMDVIEPQGPLVPSRPPVSNYQKLQNAVRWAMISGGDRYIIVFITYKERNGVLRPALHCSPTLFIDDKRLPIGSVLLYMLLTGRDAQESLVKKHGITVPDAGPTIDEELERREREERQREMHRRHEEKRLKQSWGPSRDPRRSYRQSQNAVSKASWVILQRKPGSEKYALTRVHLADAPSQDTGTTLTLTINPDYSVGGAGLVYRTVPPRFIVKFALPIDDALTMLQTEVDAYNKLHSAKRRPNIPTYFGLFENDTERAVILTDEGDSLESFESLTSAQKTTLYSDLEYIHDLGIVHGDFEPKNVVSNGANPVIIDFSHAETKHNCGGRDRCEELQTAYEHLFGDANASDSSASTATSAPSLNARSDDSDSSGAPLNTKGDT